MSTTWMVLAYVCTGAFGPELLATRGAAATVAAIEARAAAAEVGPSAQFAAEATALVRAGARLAAVDVIDDGEGLTLELTLATDATADRLSLVFVGDGERASAYRRARVAVPGERRVYHYEAELVALLARGPVDALVAECGGYFVEGAGGGASAEPYDYHVVTGVARGAGAGRFVARELAAGLEHGMRLAGIEPSTEIPAGAVAAVELVLVDGGQEIVHVGIDGDGRIVAAELRWSPVAFDAWGESYAGGERLARSLRKARAVSALRLEQRGDEAPRLTVELTGGAAMVIDGATFEADDEEELDTCPC
jgi:hypothetical protein